MNFAKQAAVAAASLGLLFSSATAVLADTTIDINNTGAGSTNKAKVSVSWSKLVSQSNYSSVWNKVKVWGDTGGNEANKNTGDADIDTGAVTATVGIANLGNTNEAEVDDCGCEDPDVDVTIKKTGADSYNKVKVWMSKLSVFSQSNSSFTGNSVQIGGDTGGNEANKNTGDADIDTDDVTTVVEIVNEGNSNVLE